MFAAAVNLQGWPGHVVAHGSYPLEPVMTLESQAPGFRLLQCLSAPFPETVAVGTSLTCPVWMAATTLLLASRCAETWDIPVSLDNGSSEWWA